MVKAKKVKRKKSSKKLNEIENKINVQNESEALVDALEFLYGRRAWSKLECERERYIGRELECVWYGVCNMMNRFLKDACEIDDGSTDQQNPLKTNDATKMLSQINKNKIPRKQQTNHNVFLMEQANDNER